jgi:hypothetical protein
MEFPVVIRHRREKATIYGKSENYPFYRVCYYVARRRRVRSFKTNGETKEEAEKWFAVAPAAAGNVISLDTASRKQAQ